MAERKKLEDKLNQKQDSQDRTLELSERTFNFCAYAHYHFTKGDLSTKRAILSSIGDNITLKDKKLTIGEYEPFLIVKNVLNEIRSFAPALEPKNNQESPIKNKLPELVDQNRLTWLPGYYSD